MIHRALCGLVFLQLLASPLRAAEEPLSLVSFQFGKFGAMVDNAISPIAQFSWTPKYRFEAFFLRGDLGLTLFKDSSGIEHAVINTEVFAGLPVSVVAFEIGGGLQSWAGSFGVNPSLGANLVIPIPGYLDRFYVGYARLFVPGKGINEGKFGIGLTF